MNLPRSSRLAAGLLACAALLPLGAGGQESAPPLTLDALLAEVEARNPRLRALRAGVEAEGFREAEASTLPDPMVQLGVMNFGLPDFNTDMAMSMAPSIQLMQMVPFPGKLGLRGRVAELGTGMASAGADEAWWQTRGMAAAMYYDLYAMDRRLEVMRETLALLRDFQRIAQALYASGSGRQADVLRADVEVARMDGDIRSMEARRAGMAARLNALRDRPSGTPVPSPVLGALPLALPPVDTLRAWAEGSRPVLERGRLGVARAGVRRELARKQIWPDFTVGLSYGQREREMGVERMGSAMVGVSIPVHAGSRQLAARDEAAAMERLAEAELEGVRAEVDARIGELVAELDRVRTLTELYRAEVLPQAEANVTSSLSSYRVGAVDFMTLVDAQMTVNRYQGELFQLLGDYGRAVAALESTIGGALPAAGPTLTEGR